MFDIISREEAKEKNLFRYFINKPCKNGHISQRYVSNAGCVECRNVKNKSYEFRERKKESYDEIGILYKKTMWWRAKKRAEQKGIHFDIELSDIIIPEVCPVFGFKFEVGSGKGPSDKSPSIDRIDCKKGYVKGNIQIISFKANKIKSDCSINDIEKVLSYLKTL
jgi:hypothetical protein